MKDFTSSTTWDYLHPDVLRPKLISASIFIAAFESFKSLIIEDVKDFYIFPVGEPDERSRENYFSKVLSLNKSPLYASFEWLKEREAIDDSDIEKFNRLKKMRNSLAHGLYEKIGSEDFPDLTEDFTIMAELMQKIKVWWIMNVELPTDPDWADKEVDESGIQTGPVMMLRMLMDIALGDDETSTYYYNEIKKRTAASQPGTDNS
ncbi:hypothetical protein [Coraliomargarita parva]|uniref:hypothetical protein n=1 Tax=Coraliomargarita parva TaxID=3014050 RepID=UPI0022B52DE9|nr:hypothetical protein [Coraliomargarita parva]